MCVTVRATHPVGVPVQCSHHEDEEGLLQQSKQSADHRLEPRQSPKVVGGIPERGTTKEEGAGGSETEPVREPSQPLKGFSAGLSTARGTVQESIVVWFSIGVLLGSSYYSIVVWFRIGVLLCSSYYSIVVWFRIGVLLCSSYFSPNAAVQRSVGGRLQYSHSSVQASTAGVDEAPDHGVQDERQDLETATTDARVTH